MAGPRKVHLTEDVARRMGAATLAYERGNRDMPPVYFRTAFDEAGGGGQIRVGKVSADWAVGTCAEVKVWERVDTGCVPTHCSGLPPGEISGIPVHLCEETIDDVANLSHDVAANSWVVIGQAANGRWYLLEAGKEEGSCRQTIGGEDITKWPGWNGSIVQLLGHDENGCLKWFDSEECEEPSPGTP